MTTRNKLELEINKPTEVTLLYDEPVIGSSKYGSYFLYAVSCNGSEYYFFPSEEVHNQIKTLKRGDKFQIVKLAAQRGSRLVTQFDVKRIEDKTEPNLTSVESEVEELVSPKEDFYFETMRLCYKDAIRIQQEIGVADVEKIAVTLFIARSKSVPSHAL